MKLIDYYNLKETKNIAQNKKSTREIPQTKLRRYIFESQAKHKIGSERVYDDGLKITHHI